MPSLPIAPESQTLKIIPANRNKREVAVKIAAFFMKTVFFKQIAPKSSIYNCMLVWLVLMSIEIFRKI